MTKFYALAVIAAFKLASFQAAPPTTPLLAFSIVKPAKVVNLHAELKQQKVFLNWGVLENETADQFAIEKSLDGKNFQVTALAFGSDMPGKYEYKFLRKQESKVSYRIRLVNKDHQKNVQKSGGSFNRSDTYYCYSLSFILRLSFILIYTKQHAGTY